MTREVTTIKIECYWLGILVKSMVRKILTNVLIIIVMFGAGISMVRAAGIKTDVPTTKADMIQRAELSSAEKMANKTATLAVEIDTARENMTSTTMPVLFALIGDNNGAVVKHPLIVKLKKYLELSGQFTVVIEPRVLPTTRQDIYRCDAQYALVFYVMLDTKQEIFEWRLYATDTAELLKGKKYVRNGVPLDEWAVVIVQDMWSALLDKQGPFTSKLCYVKRTTHPRYKIMSQLCMNSIDGSNEEVIITTPRIHITPCWGSTGEFIYYSEFMPANVRLMAVTMARKRRVVLDLDGTIAGVSWSPNSADILYGRSGGIWLYQYDENQKKSTHRLLIKEKTVCANPILLSNGDIMYSTQGKIKRYIRATGEKEYVINDGYCVGPTYHEQTRQLAFSKRIKKTMQLCVYDEISKTNTQLTFDEGDKIDPCFSPCGAWLACSLVKPGKSRIVLYAIKTRTQVFITPEHEDCKHVAWSPLYSKVPKLLSMIMRRS